MCLLPHKPATTSFETAHVLQQLVSAPGLIFAVYWCFQVRVWRGLAGNECRRWMLKYRNSVQRYTVQKVIGNWRTGWYEECEPDSWNQFWMTCWITFAQVVLKAVLLVVQNRQNDTVWVVNSKPVLFTGGSVGPSPLSLVVLPLSRGFHHLCGVAWRPGWFLVLLSTPRHGNEPLLQRQKRVLRWCFCLDLDIHKDLNPAAVSPQALKSVKLCRCRNWDPWIQPQEQGPFWAGDKLQINVPSQAQGSCLIYVTLARQQLNASNPLRSPPLFSLHILNTKQISSVIILKSQNNKCICSIYF